MTAIDGATATVRQVRVGVGVLVTRDDGRVLLGERLGSHGAHTWAPPGGHLDFGETPEECAVREVAEETGLALAHVARGPWTANMFEAEGRHYVTLFMLAAAPAGAEPANLEPDCCAGWSWHAWDALPAPLFPPLAALLADGFVAPSTIHAETSR